MLICKFYLKVHIHLSTVEEKHLNYQRVVGKDYDERVYLHIVYGIDFSLFMGAVRRHAGGATHVIVKTANAEQSVIASISRVRAIGVALRYLSRVNRQQN